MEINIKADDKAIKSLTVTPAADEKVTFDNLLAVCLSMLETITKHFMKEIDITEEGKASFYDDLNALFDRFLERVFPDITPLEFSLSDAAIIYAQDKIIDIAEKKGITYEEAMKKFEARAIEYLRQKREGYIA